MITRCFLFVLLCVTLSTSSYARILRVAQWNVGHFSCGRSDESYIEKSHGQAMMCKYRSLLDSVDADIISVNEFSPAFTKAEKENSPLMAQQTVFAGYTQVTSGPKWSYNCNALFSRTYKWHEIKTKAFDSAVEKRYYQTAVIRVKRQRIVVVSAHLDWSCGDMWKVCCQRQIEELVERFRKEPYVIICGDWNVDDASEYVPFIDAGYLLANKTPSGSLLTWPSGPNPQLPIDNILVKGFCIKDVQVFNKEDLSDHCLIVADVELDCF